MYFALPASLYCEECVRVRVRARARACVCVCVCVTAYRWYMKHFYTKRERCELWTRYLPLERRPGGDWAKAMNYDIISHCTEWAFAHYLVIPDDGFVEEAERHSVISRENNSKTKLWLSDWSCLIIPNAVCTSQRQVQHHRAHVKYKHQLLPLLVCCSHEAHKINV
jgi:hypothetical protein